MSRWGEGAKPGGVRNDDWMKAIGEDREELNLEDVLISEPSHQEVAVERDQIEALCRADLNALAGIATPDMYQYPFPNILLSAWMLLCQTAIKTRDFAQIALGIPRGFGKTTMTKLFVLWCILFTKKQFILVVASTATLAENIIADISDMLSQPNIVAVFGDWTLGRETSRTDLKKFGFRGRNIIIAGIGANGSLRGLNIKNARPDVMIFEDIQTAEDAKSLTISESIETWMIGTAMKAKSPHGCLFIFNANMYPGPNSILKKLKKNHKWIKFITGAILEDGTSLWPEHRSIFELIEEFENDTASGHPEIFLSEVMNDTEVAINTSVDLSKIRRWPYSEGELPQGKCVIIDPASGKGIASVKNKRGLDPTTIMIMEVYDSIPAFTKVVVDQFSPGNTILQAILWCLTYNIKVVIIEDNSYQATLLYWFTEICKQKGITGIVALPVSSAGVAKNGKISNALKALMAGEIIIHDSIRSLVTNQIANWNPMKRDNDDGILDCIGFAPKILELYSSEICTAEHLETDYDTATAAVDESPASYQF